MICACCWHRRDVYTEPAVDDLPWQNRAGPLSLRLNTGTVSKTPLKWGGACVGFPKHADVILNWAAVTDCSGMETVLTWTNITFWAHLLMALLQHIYWWRFWAQLQRICQLSEILRYYIRRLHSGMTDPCKNPEKTSLKEEWSVVMDTCTWL